MASEDYIYSVAEVGNWTEITSSTGGDGGSWLAINVNSANAQIPSATFPTTIDTAGNYSVIVYTPGCIQDDSCSTRGSVSITVNATYNLETDQPFAPATTVIAQTNNFDKYDQAYFGWFNASSNDFSPSVALAAIEGQSLPQHVVAWKVRYALLAAATSSSSVSGAPSTTSGSNSPTDPGRSSPTPNSSNSDSNSLPTGVIAGLAVAIVVAVLLAIATAYLFISRRRQKRRTAMQSQTEGEEKAELDGNRTLPEKSGAEIQEMEHTKKSEVYHELEQPSGLHEAPGIEPAHEVDSKAKQDRPPSPNWLP